tara:strand:- start:500 stop:1648 length:1149 start_codon:yes stop_codon:yes gene_type:complete
MALVRRHRTNPDIWPGFVDALATLLMVIIFLLMIFAVSQFYLSDALVGRDKALESLNTKMGELADLLDFEQKTKASLLSEKLSLSAKLESSISREEALASELAATKLELEKSETERAVLKGEIRVSRDNIIVLKQDLVALETLKKKFEQDAAKLQLYLSKRTTSLNEQKKISEATKAQLALLNQQMSALRIELLNIKKALEISERKDKDAQIKIANLGKRLNAALASKVHQLARYRSKFFGRLRDVLGDRRDVQIVGDRFVFQSEVLFTSGSAVIGNKGKDKLRQFGRTLKEIASKVPDDIDWILRVDGHTDQRPIRTIEFPSNWELSAARAISVVKFLRKQGLPAKRFAATGFAASYPLDNRSDEIAYRRNRRIEMKFDQR